MGAILLEFNAPPKSEASWQTMLTFGGYNLLHMLRPRPATPPNNLCAGSKPISSGPAKVRGGAGDELVSTAVSSLRAIRHRGLAARRGSYRGSA